ncbi:MAG: ABC transporter ATP-binding protein [Ruminococcaceae bacterium]|nr:ABC transporter ATP-binding protein [Oscillospiraceae bacterium]
MIRTEQLRKVYRVGKEKVVALANIDLEIEQGEICCIVGQSGSGKSTLLNMLAGLEKPTRGLVAINGKKVSAMDENQLAVFRQENLGFIFQSYNLLAQLTAAENVALPLMFTGMSRRKRMKRAVYELKQMGLGKRAGHKPTEMSGGQQQRVGIARAFVGKPQVIFADEPTGNLDTHTTRQVLRTMLERAESHNITFVMVTHERELSSCGDRIITLQDGHVISNEKLDEATKKANRDALFADLDEKTLMAEEAEQAEHAEQAQQARFAEKVMHNVIQADLPDTQNPGGNTTGEAGTGQNP